MGFCKNKLSENSLREQTLLGANSKFLREQILLGSKFFLLRIDKK